jgi:hypothetical protein
VKVEGGAATSARLPQANPNAASKTMTPMAANHVLCLVIPNAS